MIGWTGISDRFPTGIGDRLHRNAQSGDSELGEHVLETRAHRAVTTVGCLRNLPQRPPFCEQHGGAISALARVNPSTDSTRFGSTRTRLTGLTISTSAATHRERWSTGHLFITVLAYQLVQVIRTRLRAGGETASWTTLRRILEGQQRITATFARADGRTVHVRKATRAEPPQQALYDALGIDAEPGGTRKTIV